MVQQSPDALLRLDDVRVTTTGRNGGVPLMDGVTFTIGPGERVALVGESGSGKSMTCFSITGLLPEGVGVTGGSVRWKGTALTDLDSDDYRRHRGREFAMVYQEPLTALNPLLRIGDQVAEAASASGSEGKRGRRSGEVSKRVAQMLDRVGIADARRVMRQYPHELSGGMRQRVMIAMALIGGPDLLIADEPTTALDVTIETQVLRLMYDLSVETTTAILLVTHDLNVVRRLVDRVLVMYAGQIVEEGCTEQIFDDPQHPYTRALINSAPRLGGPRDQLEVLAGNVPAPGEWANGCRFNDRCPEKMPVCEEAMPPMLTTFNGGRAACWLHDSAVGTEKATP